MRRNTHVAGAVLAGAGVSLAAGFAPPFSALVVVGAIAAAMAPDFDRALDTGPDHRSATHSLVLAGGFVILLAAGAVALFGVPEGATDDARDGLALGRAVLEDPHSHATLLAVGAAAGYVSHLLLDSLTKKRIWLLAPGGRRFGPGLFRTGGATEMLLLVAMTATLIAVLPATFVSDRTPRGASESGPEALVGDEGRRP